MATTYKGIITRKNNTRGVTLEAKVVTPNKKKAQSKQYEVKVASLESSAYEKAMADAQYVRNVLINELGGFEALNDVASSISSIMPASVANASQIGFTIKDNPNYSSLNACFESGIFKSAPAIGKQDAVGDIVVYAENDGERVELSFPITVKAANVTTFLNDTMQFEQIWRYFIHGDNAADNYTLLTGNMNIGDSGVRIISGAELKNDPELSEIYSAFTEGYIKITTTVTDSASNAMKDALFNNASRYNTAGVLGTKPSYMKTYAYVQDNSTNILARTGSSDGGFDKRYFQIPGIGISCTVQFCDAQGNPDTDVMPSPITRGPRAGATIYTISQYLTNSEVIERARKNANFNLNFWNNSGLSGQAIGSAAFAGAISDPTSDDRDGAIEKCASADFTSVERPYFSLIQASTADEAVISLPLGSDAIPLQFTTIIDTIKISSDNGDNFVDYTSTSTLAGTAFEDIFKCIDETQPISFENVFGSAEAGKKWKFSINSANALDKMIMIRLAVKASKYSTNGSEPSGYPDLATQYKYAAIKVTGAPTPSEPEEEPVGT